MIKRPNVRPYCGQIAGVSLARQLVFCAVADHCEGKPFDIVGPNTKQSIISVNGSVPPVSTYLGTGRRCNGNDSNYLNFNVPNKLKFTQADSWTFHILTTVDGGNNAGRGLLQSDQAAGTRHLLHTGLKTTNVFEMEFGSTGATLGSVAGSTTISVNALRVRHYTGVRDVPADLISVWVDGRKDGEVTDQSTGTWTVNQADYITKYQGGGAPWNGKIVAVYIWNRPLRTPEIQQLYHDPWCMFQRRRVILGSFQGAAPGSGVFAGSNQVIGGGVYVS